MKDRLAEIFIRQAYYVKTLEEVYAKNGMWPGPYPRNLDDRIDQEHFRLLAWRTTEEIIEAVSAYTLMITEDDFQECSQACKAFREEVADALHFFIELAIATDVSEAELLVGASTVLGDDDMLSWVFEKAEPCCIPETIPQAWSYVIHTLGLAMHRLRQRPWRTDHRPTNRILFVNDLAVAFGAFIRSCKRSGIDADQLYEAYFAKGLINDKRTEQQV